MTIHKNYSHNKVKNVNTYNPIKITLMEWKLIFGDIYKARDFKESLKIFFGPPKTRER